ncbi:MAG: DUF721 domain-containing protein [Actinobacteria bacterium]|nr:DUF721 domain-containing protein [Actinomycetota bacterium]
MERLYRSVRGVLGAAGVPDADTLSEIAAAWPACVGDAIARHAWPLRLSRDGTLRVACSSAIWAFELGRMGPELLESLRARLGDAAPSALRFAPGPVPEPDVLPAETPAAAPAPSPGDRDAATSLAASIADPELREIARRAIAASLARRTDDRAF